MRIKHKMLTAATQGVILWCYSVVTWGRLLMREFLDYFLCSVCFRLCSIPPNAATGQDRWRHTMLANHMGLFFLLLWIHCFLFTKTPLGFSPPQKGKLEDRRNGSVTQLTAGRRDQMPSEPRQGSKVTFVLMITWWTVLPLCLFA